MPKYEITVEEFGRYVTKIDADDEKDARVKALKELSTYGTGDWLPVNIGTGENWLPVYINKFVILNVDKLKGV